MVNSPALLRYDNNDFVDVAEITNSITSKSSGTVSEQQLEQTLCYNLVKNNLPLDVSNNLDQTQTLTITGGKNKLNGVMLNNNEDIFDSELMALKLNYSTSNVTSTDESFSYAMTTALNSVITKKGTTVSYENSSLRLGVEFNNDDQLSIDNNDNLGDWKINFERDRNSQNNYYAAVNSNLNTSDGSYPLNITELVSADYIMNDGRYISSINGSTNLHTYSSFDSSYTLASNDLSYNIDPEHSYQSSDFTMYKLVQDTPEITLTIGQDATGADLPISTSTNADITTISLSEFKSNVEKVLGNDIIDLQNGFKIDIEIADNNGEFSIDSNDILSINTNNIVDSNEFLTAGIRSGNTNMYIDVTNGSLTLSGNDISSNVSSVGLTSGYEYLNSSYNTTNGNVKIYVEPTTNRATINYGNNEDQITKEINILYNCVEALAYDPTGCSVLSDEMRINPDVQLGAGIVVPTTTVNLSQCFTPNDLRNFKKSGDSVLTIANNNNFNLSMITYSDVSFVSNIGTVYNNSDIVFIAITNKNILTEETPLVASNSTAVPNSLATVTVQNMTFSNYSYDDYKIRLDNKTISVDLSNSVQATNGWYLASTNESDYLVANPIKTSILYDDCLFMRSGLDSSFNYTFSIATPTVTNAQSIKHRIDISFYDVDNSTGTPSMVERYAYLDDNDITYSTPTVSNTIDVLNNNEYSINDNVPQQINSQSKIIVKKVISTVKYYASFEPKLPFYTNIKLDSPEITETVTSYKLFDSNSNELPDIYLKYLKDVDNNSLSLVNVAQPQSYSTTLKVTPKNCSTLKATFLGSTNGTLEQVPYTNNPDVDPFFNTSTYITHNGDTSSIYLNIQVTYPTILSDQYYIIDTTNKPGENASFDTTLYIYDTTNHDGTNSSFDNFQPYNNDWVNWTDDEYWWNYANPPTPIVLRNTVTVLNSELTLTIYDETDNVIATLKQPNTFINDFNIIRCLDPLVMTYSQINYLNNGWSGWNTKYTTATNFGLDRNIFIADGIYLKTDGKNPSQFSWVEFTLNSDTFSVEFVNDYTSINNGWNNIHNFTDITNSYDVVQNNYNWGNELILTVHSGDDVTRSVTFDKYRGYNRISPNGVDNIDIIRTGTTAVFTVITDISGTFTQTFNNFANGSTYTVDNATDASGNSFDLGLDIYGQLSLFDGNNGSERIYINVTGASISWRFYNPNYDTIDYYNSSTLLATSFYDLFNWKPRRILSNYYTISIQYSIPQVKYYALNSSGPNLYGNPINKSQSDWGSENLVTLDVTNNLYESGISVYRTQNYVPSGFTSYFVVTPPQMILNYNYPDANIISFPYNPSSQYGSSPHTLQKTYYVTIDSDSDHNSYYDVPILLNNGIATIKNYNISNIQKYNNVENDVVTNRFVILGNYIDIKYYNQPYDPTRPNDLLTSSVTDYVYSGRIDAILYDSCANKLDVTKANGSTQYELSYRQFIGTNSNNLNSNFNIKVNISDAFLTPPPSGINVVNNDLFINLTAPASTAVTLYQSNVRLVDSSFILVIDKYETSGVNYNALLSLSSISEVFFVVTKHWTSSFSVDGTSLPSIGDESYGDKFDVTDLFTNITPSMIEFTEDTNFTKANSGITLSALSPSGITNLTNLITYNSASNLLSKSYYIYAADIIKVNSLFGLPVYRLTNFGNVRTPSITTYSVNIASPTQLYDNSGNSIMNPNNNGTQNTAIVTDIQPIVNTIPSAPR